MSAQAKVFVASLFLASAKIKSHFKRLLSLKTRDGAIDGFTLVELLITIALISMICATVVPNLLQSIYAAKVKRAIVDISTISYEIDRFYRKNLYLPPDLDALGMGIPTDPFGHSYVYFPFLTAKDHKKVRLDKWITPLNSDYDLYSKGRDGATARTLDDTRSEDDVVRASDGAFIGLAIDY